MHTIVHPKFIKIIYSVMHIYTNEEFVKMFPSMKHQIVDVCKSTYSQPYSCPANTCTHSSIQTEFLKFLWPSQVFFCSSIIEKLCSCVCLCFFFLLSCSSNFCKNELNVSSFQTFKYNVRIQVFYVGL